MNIAPKRPYTDEVGAMAALCRARLRAEREASRTGTSLVVVVDGKIVLVPPRPEAAIDAEEAADQSRRVVEPRRTYGASAMEIVNVMGAVIRRFTK
jgi:hypothetical protein